MIHQLRFPREYRLPRLFSRDAQLGLERAVELAASIANVSGADVLAPDQLENELAELAIQLWRLGNGLLDPETREPTDETRMAYRRLEATWDSMNALGIEVRDYTFQEIAEHGITDLRILAEEPRADLNRRTVIQTIKPAVIYRGNQLAMAEVIVGIPLEPDKPKHQSDQEN